MVETQTKARVTKLNKIPTAQSGTDKTKVEILSTPAAKLKSEDGFKISKKENIIVPKKTSKKENVLKRAKKKIVLFSEKIKSNHEKHREDILKFCVAFSLLAACVAICFSTCSVGYTVSVGENALGTIPSKTMFEDIMNKIENDVFSITGQEFKLKEDATLSLDFVLDRDMLTKAEITEKIKEKSDMFIPAHAILIDGKMVVALPGEEMAKNTIEEYKKSFMKNETDAKVDFANDVQVSYMFVPKAILYTKDAAVNYLLNGEFSYYKAQEEQPVSQFSQKLGVSEDSIKETNKIENETIQKGQVLKIYSGRMFADVMSIERTEREIVIPFETVKKESGDIYQGKTKIEKVGANGLKKIEECITYINGVVTKRDVLEENILKSPTVQIELIGTKDLPSPVGTGNLAVPTNGEISSRYGSRWGRQHQGIDLAAPEGTPIYAADNGTITYSEFNDGGYGYMIKIDHGNGVETYYAHCSELLAEEGEIVGKGDLIAKVGNTGRSTGAHLHFEVRKEGTPIDPIRHLN